MDFTHLHVHTEYSLLDGSNKIKEYVSRVKELGMDSAAITDHGVMYGCIDFYRAAREAGIRPILGCEVYVAPGSRFDREGGSEQERYYHLVLLAENNQGYSNLIKLVSRGFTEGYYYKPRVDLELLREYHEGIIALSACLAGEIAHHLERGMYDEAREAALRYRDIFGADSYFLEMQDHGISEQQLVNQQLVRLHEETGIPLVVTNDVHYTYREDEESHDILLCLQTNKKLSDEDRMRYEGGQYYVKSPEEMADLFPYVPEALENTHQIAMRCQVEIEFGVTKLPRFDVPSGVTSWEYLNRLCYEGLSRRYDPVTEELQERLAYELSTIQDMGYVDYFLIVWDFVKYAKDHEIMVGPGRGSAAGSLVSYTLGITELDPIKYDLLFERFLNPERVSMPDIDIDFCFERRQEVIDYVVRKYGKDKVAQIVTFGTMAARGVIRDVGRVMDLPYAQVAEIAKMVPNELNMTIDKALSINPELSKTYREDPQIHHLIDMAKRLEGLPRHTSMHAAGVVICQKAVEEYVPLSRASDGTITTQFTMTTLEELGLLKMDFLGLRTLTVIQNAVKQARKSGAQALDMNAISYEDLAVYASLATGETDGVFQLESAGMQNFMKELKPQNLEDVIAGIALYRPGPMEFIPQYIRGKNHPETITYDCPQLEPILKPTYGCIVYQEQVMQIVQSLAGYTLGRSDILRRAMSKKKAAVMEKERQNFVYGNEEEGVPGCIHKGISEQIANKIYDEMIDFAKYAFNKSHAAAYAVVSYQTAYLKVYYPVEFMAALLTSVVDNPLKVTEYITSCRKMGIKILPPDINSGESAFSVDHGSIRYGLSAIKSVGKSVIDAIVREREEHGVYLSMKDFLTRMSGRDLNKRGIESFIKAGALDCLAGTRYQKMLSYSLILDNVTQEKKNSMAGQMTLFDLVPEEEKETFEVSLPDVGEYDKGQLLAFEKEVLGFYISGHPLEPYARMMEKNCTAVTTDFQLEEESKMPKVRDNQQVIVGGIITKKTIKYTKNNQVMAFLTLEDLVGTVEVIVFPRNYEQDQSLLEEERLVFIEGRVSAEVESDSKLILEWVVPFEEVPREVWIQFAAREDFYRRENDLYEFLRETPGRDAVVIYLRQDKSMKRLSENCCIAADDAMLGELRERYGQDNVKVVEKSIEKFVKMN